MAVLPFKILIAKFTLLEKRTEGERSCDKVKKIFSWIKCDANNKFTPLQCNPNTGRCFCIDADSGKRVNSKTTTMKMADSNICSTCECDIHAHRHTWYIYIYTLICTHIHTCTHNTRSCTQTHTDRQTHTYNTHIHMHMCALTHWQTYIPHIHCSKLLIRLLYLLLCTYTLCAFSTSFYLSSTELHQTM